jgi:hypothetical protein
VKRNTLTISSRRLWGFNVGVGDGTLHVLAAIIEVEVQRNLLVNINSVCNCG